MASSIIGGLVKSGHRASRISASDPYPPSLEKLQAIAPIAVSDSNAEAVKGADVIILAVKPQVMAQACESIAESIQASGAVAISIAAGITLESLQRRLGSSTPVIRAMPNTPALLGCGASGLFASEQVSPRQKAYAESILRAVGISSWVETEAELDAITALSGSGPAYFFIFIESMIKVGIELGLDKETASAMAKQTALGASRMAIENDIDLGELRRRVTSPGGTTERAVASFEQNGLEAVVREAMLACADRAKEISREMG
ncbi:MAG: pyrroline-5-carboxylate reductase [Halioglobus sp.]|jgi:pyrroline-5-carboxylate reductase